MSRNERSSRSDVGSQLAVAGTLVVVAVIAAIGWMTMTGNLPI